MDESQAGARRWIRARDAGPQVVSLPVDVPETRSARSGDLQISSRSANLAGQDLLGHRCRALCNDGWHAVDAAGLLRMRAPDVDAHHLRRVRYSS
jgi:hypothetical protein